MKEDWGLARQILLWSFPLLAGSFLLFTQPEYFRDPVVLGALILIEIILASLWHYQDLYFGLIVTTWVLAGANVPFEGAASASRWLVLGVGAFAGAAIWMRHRKQTFSAIHLAAVLCIPAAAVSAVDSNDPATSLMKVLSLFLLFLYCSSGVRVATAGRELQFMGGILLGCEICVFWSAFAYGVGWAFWGNPNSLGAVTGVVLMPFMLWGFLVAEERMEKYRRGLALLICLILLFASASRASILTAACTSIVMCFCLRRMRVLLEGTFLVVLALAASAVIEPSHFDQLTRNLTTDILYKGKREQGMFGSRQSPWQETMNSLKQHPWFGTGFGTSDLGNNTQVAKISLLEGVYTREGGDREHGNSYLAAAEYLGFLGVIPFVFLLLLVIRMVAQVCRWMRSTDNAASYAVPLSMILMGGLVHAFFEDWLFAVGYYLCLFFWVCAFLLNDFLPERKPLHFAAASPAHPRTAPPVFSEAIPR